LQRRLLPLVHVLRTQPNDGEVRVKAVSNYNVNKVIDRMDFVAILENSDSFSL
jgi:hypothetical protein